MTVAGVCDAPGKPQLALPGAIGIQISVSLARWIFRGWQKPAVALALGSLGFFWTVERVAGYWV